MRIALLEDDVAQAELMRSWLAGAGHAVSGFVLARDFLKAIARESFDLVMLDWELPDINGDQVLVKLREVVDWPIPVLFVTNRDSEHDIVRALQSGADDYVVKPAKRLETLARVQALGRRARPQGRQPRRLWSTGCSASIRSMA